MNAINHATLVRDDEPTDRTALDAGRAFAAVQDWLANVPVADRTFEDVEGNDLLGPDITDAPSIDDMTLYLDSVHRADYPRELDACLRSVGGSATVIRRADESEEFLVGQFADRQRRQRVAYVDALTAHMDRHGHRDAFRAHLLPETAGTCRRGAWQQAWVRWARAEAEYNAAPIDVDEDVDETLYREYSDAFDAMIAVPAPGIPETSKKLITARRRWIQFEMPEEVLDALDADLLRLGSSDAFDLVEANQPISSADWLKVSGAYRLARANFERSGGDETRCSALIERENEMILTPAPDAAALALKIDVVREASRDASLDEGVMDALCADANRIAAICQASKKDRTRQSRWDKAFAELTAAATAVTVFATERLNPAWEAAQIEFPPEPDTTFRERYTQSEKVTYRLTLPDIVGRVRPSFISDEDWDRITTEHDAYRASKEAACDRHGIDALEKENDLLIDQEANLVDTVLRLPVPSTSELLWKLDKVRMDRITDDEVHLAIAADVRRLMAGAGA